MLPELYVAADSHQGHVSLKFDILGGRRVPSVGTLASDFKSDQCSDVVSRDIRLSLNQSIGVLCLSKEPQSLLMWSHYADEYAGAVIEFDEDSVFFNGKVDVEYAESRPIKDISAYILAGEAIPIAELCVKSTQWKYEEEVRLIRLLSDCKKIGEKSGFPVYVMDVPRDCIKSVTLGERMPLEHQREIWNLVKETNISLSLAAIANWGYEFRLEPIKSDMPFSQLPPCISPRTAHIFKELSCNLGEAARWMIVNHPMSEVANNKA